MLQTLTIRQGGPLDVELIYALSIQTFQETFESSNSAENMRNYIEANFSYNQLEEEVSQKNSTFWLAFDGDIAAGYVKFKTGHNPKELQDCRALEIERLYAIKKYVGRNIGKQLMLHSLEFAKQNAFDTVWLGVWEHNERALAFYKKHGFEKFGSHIFMLGADAQTDLLMKKKIE